MENIEDLGLIPDIDPLWSETTKEYCIGYYQEKQKEIRFKKNRLPPDKFAKYINENLTNFVNHIENFERDQRGKGFNENRDKVIKSYYFTLPLWQNELKELNMENKEPKNPEYLTHPQQILLFEKLRIIKYLQKEYKLPPGKLAKVISYLSNRGFENTKFYIRSVSQKKDQTTSSKKNLNPNTPKNTDFIKQIMKELGLPE